MAPVPPGDGRQQIPRRRPHASAAVAGIAAWLAAGPAALAARQDISAPAGATASLGGVVLDARTRLPVRAARIEVEGHDEVAATRPDGRFELVGLRAGRRTFRVEVHERRTRPQPVDLPAGRHTEIRIAVVLPEGEPLPDRVVSLPPLEVEITSSDHASKLRGFFTRARSGRGTYITREDIERREPDDTTDLLREILGLRVTTVSAGRQVVTTNRGCRLTVFLDGLAVPGLSPDEIPPRDIEAMEVYASAIETPARFRAPSSCGALVIWTRDPGRSAG